MPWTAAEAKGFTKKATTPELRKKWVKIANGALKAALAKGKSQKEAEASAIRIANSAMSDSDESLASVIQLLGDAEPQVTRVSMCDAIELDDAAKVRITRDGFLVAYPRIARTGIQLYNADECGIDPDTLDGRTEVRVYRPEAEVFAKDALHSYTHITLTNDHPPELVTPVNWKKYSIGDTGDEALRDGNAIRVPMMMRDAQAIKDYRDGKRQLSVGYTCDLEMESGVTDAGEEYDAIQRNIRANHLAVVTAARGGSTLKIGDDNNQQQETRDMSNLQKFIIDNVPCEMSDVAHGVITRLITQKDKEITDAKKKAEEMEEECDNAKEKAAKDATTAGEAIKAKDAEIVTLKKQVEDGKITPQMLDQMVKDRMTVATVAQQLMDKSKLKIDGESVASIQKQVVLSRVGDVAKDWDDKQIAASFQVLALSAKDTSNMSATDQARTAFMQPYQHPLLNDAASAAEKAYKDYTAGLSTAYLGDRDPNRQKNAN
jgi:hypothetical protein